MKNIIDGLLNRVMHCINLTGVVSPDSRRENILENQDKRSILEDKYKELLVLFDKKQQRFLLDGDHSGLKLELANEFQSSLKEKKCTKEDVVDICKEIERIKTKTRPFTMRDKGARAIKYFFELVQIWTIPWMCEPIYLGVAWTIVLGSLNHSPALTLDFFDREQRNFLRSGDYAELKTKLASELYSSLQEKECTTSQVINICKDLESMMGSRTPVGGIGLFKNKKDLLTSIKNKTFGVFSNTEGVLSFVKNIAIASLCHMGEGSSRNKGKNILIIMALCCSLENSRTFRPKRTQLTPM